MDRSVVAAQLAHNRALLASRTGAPDYGWVALIVRNRMLLMQATEAQAHARAAHAQAIEVRLVAEHLGWMVAATAARLLVKPVSD